MKKLSIPEERRLFIFKRLLRKEEKYDLLRKTDKELLEILNLAVIPNAMSVTALKHSVFFHFLMITKAKKAEEIKHHLAKTIDFVSNFDKTEATILKFGIIHGFSSSSWRKELFRYINIPITSKDGRKIISSSKFKEIFFFAYNISKRGEKNERQPRF